MENPTDLKSFLLRKAPIKAPWGFTLLEMLVVLTLIGVLFASALFTAEGMLERWTMNRALAQVLQTLKHAQFLALTQQRSHGILGAGAQLWITQKPLPDMPWHDLPSDLAVSANQWPSFSPYGFAKAGTVSLESRNYFIQIKVGPIGSIRQTALQSK